MNSSLSHVNISLMIPTVTATAIMVAGVVDDLRSRKFHNWLFLVCVALAALSVLVSVGFGGFAVAILGMLAGVAVFLPLVLMKIIGAGDMKLMAAFGLAAGWDAVLQTALYGVFWGALFGILATVFRGQGRMLMNNMTSIVLLRGRRDELTLHKIPFTIAVAMGWMSVLAMRGA